MAKKSCSGVDLVYIFQVARGRTSVSGHVDWEWGKDGRPNEKQGPSQEEKGIDGGKANNCPMRTVFMEVLF